MLEHNTNQPIEPENREQVIRKVKIKLSEEELANLIIHEQALLYGVKATPWKDIHGIDKGFYIRVARVVLNKFYHQIPSYPEGVPTHCGYAICYMSGGVHHGMSKRKVEDTLRGEFAYLESYDVLSQAVMNALQTCTAEDLIF